jgi:hypothetical protein
MMKRQASNRDFMHPQSDSKRTVVVAVGELTTEYLSSAEDVASPTDYSDMKSVRRSNAVSDRMRKIVDEVVSLGRNAIVQFASVLNSEPAALRAAHHLVEKADLDSATLSKCIARVELAEQQAKAKGDLATAMGEGMWLKEWKARKA